MRLSLVREVQVWERYLTGTALGPRLVLWTWRKLLLATPVWLALALARVCISDSLPDFLASMCGVLPQYSAGTAAFLLARRTPRLAALLHRVRLLAEDVDVDGHDPKVFPRMQRCASLVRFFRHAVAVYMPMGLSMLVAQQVLGSPPAPTLGEEPANKHVVGQALMAVNETTKWAYYAISYFVLWALLASVLLALDAIYESLVQRIRTANGWHQVRGAARLHLQLLSLQSDLKDLTFQPLLHVLAGAGVVPLINTYQMMCGMANVFSFLTFSTLPFVFGTLSALGDGLEVRAEHFSLAVFGGSDVLGESLATSRLRQMLVTRSAGHQGRPSGISMRGFGPLNLRAAFVALNRWYQYLQLLVGAAT